MDNKKEILAMDSRVNHQLKQKHTLARTKVYAIIQQEEGRQGYEPNTRTNQR